MAWPGGHRPKRTIARAAGREGGTGRQCVVGFSFGVNGIEKRNGRERGQRLQSAANIGFMLEKVLKTTTTVPVKE